MNNNPDIFLTRENQHIQEINKHFDGILNNYGPMVFAVNQEQNKSYKFKDMLLQPEKSYLFLNIIKEVETHEDQSNWTPMKKGEVINKHRSKDGKLKTILSTCSFKLNIFPDEILMIHKSRICAHGGMKQWGVKY